MQTWRKAYEWTRAILAVFGAMALGLVLLLALVVFGIARGMPDEHGARAPAPNGSFAEADSLLNEAGIERSRQPLELVGQNPGEWIAGDRSNVQLYCLRAPGLELGARWLATSQLEPMMVPAAKATFDAAHAAHACVPSWTDAAWKQMRVQPMQLSWSQGQLGFARMALYDRDTQMLYLVSRSTPTSPPAEPPLTPPAPPAASPSSE